MQIRTLEIVLLVFLLEQCQVLLDLLLLAQVELTLHPRKSLDLRILGNLSLKLLRLNALS